MSGDLEKFLREYSGLVLVNLWADECEASRYMEQLMHEFERYATIPVLRLMLHEHRKWAMAHGIYGTPALIAYYQNRPLFRLIGRVTPAELLQRLRQHGIDQV
jgi:thiol-disulfide isomerase/thioredoxin